jgi:hypothetical protein
MLRNPKVFLLVLGVIIGGVIGYATRPEIAEIRIGKLNIEISGKGVGRHNGGEITSEQWKHIAIFALIGGVLGLGLGFAMERGRIKF